MDTDLRLLPLAALVAATLSLGAPVALAEDPLDQEIILIDEDAAGADAIVIEDEEAGADIIVIEDEEADAEVIVVDETEAAADEIVIETEEAGADQIVVEEEPAGGEEIVIEVEEPAAEEITVEGEEIVIEPAPAETIELVPEEEPGTIMIEEAAPAAQEVASGEAAEEYGPASPWSARADKLRLEAAPLVSSSDDVDVFGYGSAELSLGWDAGGTWEARLAGRADGYVQTGDPDFEEADLDYGESFVRYRGDKLNVTLGTQTVIDRPLERTGPDPLYPRRPAGPPPRAPDAAGGGLPGREQVGPDVHADLPRGGIARQGQHLVPDRPTPRRGAGTGKHAVAAPGRARRADRRRCAGFR